MQRLRERGERILLIASPLIGVLYGVLARWIFGLDASKDWFAIITLTYIFGVPVVVGVLAVLVLPEAQARRWPNWLAYPAAASLLTAATTLLLAWEGLICAVVWLPLFLFLALLGGVAAGLGRRVWGSARSRSLVFGVVALAPFLIAPLEPSGGASTTHRAVANRIDVDAPASVIWEQIREVPPIRPRELEESWTLRIGFPRPIEARLEGSGVGAIRYATFEREVLFIEEITEWRPGVSLAFEITPERVPRRAFDEHVAIGGRFFDVLRGRYEIEPRHDHGFTLILTSEQRISTPFNGYTRLWTDLFMSDVQRTILRVIKARSEAAAVGERRTGPRQDGGERSSTAVASEAQPASGREDARRGGERAPAPMASEGPTASEGGLVEPEEPLRVGGDVQAPRRLPTTGRRPTFQQFFETGRYHLCTCIVRLVVSEAGEPGRIQVLKPESEQLPAEVEAEIRQGLESWRFTPASRHGEPVAVWYYLTIHHCPCRP